MFNKSDQSTLVESDANFVEFLVEPLDEKIGEHILSNLTGKKLYLSRVDDIDLQSYIISASTPLFTFRHNKEKSEPKENLELEENKKSDKKLIEISSDFRFEDSNIVQSGKNYISSLEGLFIIEKSRPRVIQVSLDGSCDVNISEDSMEVIVDIYPSIGDNPINTVEQIVDKILDLGVVTEINTVLLSAKLKEVEDNKNKCLNLSVSSGKRSVDGINGRLENCTKVKEKFENFNFDEFHRVNPVISVKEGDIVAILHPPTEGEPGHNVFNQVVNQIPGKPFRIKIGKNTKYSEEDDTQIIAKTDGFVDLREDSITITDTFTVHGDIDFKSGNIVSKGSLKVLGNVKNEFTLCLTKDIEIGGYVGDAYLESDQNIMIRGGFLGKGKGILKAKGDIEVKFVENQTVFTRGSLKIAKEALNSKLFVKNAIVSKGVRAAIVGGHAIAGDYIEIDTIGNSSESETILEVGFDYLKRNSIADNKEGLKRVREKLEEVDKEIFEFAKMKRLNPKFADRLKLLAELHKKLVAEIDRIKAENLKITNEIYVPTSSKIVARGTVYPGSKIGINGRFMIVKNLIKSKTFILSHFNEVIAH